MLRARTCFYFDFIKPYFIDREVIGSVTVSRKRLNVFHVVDTRVNLASIHHRDTNFVAHIYLWQLSPFVSLLSSFPLLGIYQKHCNARVPETTLDGVFAGRETTIAHNSCHTHKYICYNTYTLPFVLVGTRARRERRIYARKSWNINSSQRERA